MSTKNDNDDVNVEGLYWGTGILNVLLTLILVMNRNVSPFFLVVLYLPTLALGWACHLMLCWLLQDDYIQEVRMP